MAKYKKSDLLADRDSFLYRAFIIMLSQNGFVGGPSAPKEWADLRTKEEFEISVVIEGVEIDYMKFVERYASVFDECSEEFERKAEERAKEIVREKYSRTMRAIQEVFEASNEDSLEWIRKDYKEEE